MKNNNKIGIGVVTCNRPDFFKQAIKSIPQVDSIVVVNDGKPYNNEIYPSYVDEVIQHEFNQCVGVSKNDAMKYLMNQGCDHIFIMEDDIMIIDENICEQYIKTAEASGIWHLNYGLHGSYNRDKRGKPIRKRSIDYGKYKVDLYHNILGAWSYYYKGIIKHAGLIDEKYHNAWEHVDHTQKVISLGLHPPFWYFADIHHSEKYIQDIEANFGGSQIRSNQAAWMANMENGAKIYANKWGHKPVDTPDLGIQNALEKIEIIRNNYARKLM